jgi:hypothetical protein
MIPAPLWEELFRQKATHREAAGWTDGSTPRKPVVGTPFTLRKLLPGRRGSRVRDAQSVAGVKRFRTQPAAPSARAPMERRARVVCHAGACAACVSGEPCLSADGCREGATNLLLRSGRLRWPEPPLGRNPLHRREVPVRFVRSDRTPRCRRPGPRLRAEHLRRRSTAGRGRPPHPSASSLGGVGSPGSGIACNRSEPVGLETCRVPRRRMRRAVIDEGPPRSLRAAPAPCPRESGPHAARRASATVGKARRA